jgi:hypothetical protein
VSKDLEVDNGSKKLSFIVGGLVLVVMLLGLVSSTFSENTGVESDVQVEQIQETTNDQNPF